MGKNRRKYMKEFIQESVEFLLRSGKPASKLAAELGISHEILSRWRREYETHQEKAFPGQGKPIKAELAQLRKELADVKMVKTLGIRRNRYYRWINSSELRKHQSSNEKVLIEKIKKIQNQSRYSYGTPRITDDLKDNGVIIKK